MRVLQLFAKISFLVALSCGFAASDSIQLRSGRHVEGKFIGGTATMVGFMSDGAVEYFPTSDVLVLVFDSHESPTGALGPSPMNGKAVVTGRRVHLQRASSSGAATKRTQEPPRSKQEDRE